MDETSFQSRCAEIAADRVHGASEIARQCLDILGESARDAGVSDGAALVSLLRARADRLRSARPSMAPVANLVGEWLDALNDLPAAAGVSDIRIRLSEMARALSVRSKHAVETAAQHASVLIGRDKTVITHSYSSTVVQVFQRLASKGLKVIVTESRPLLEGQALAEQLASLNVPTTYITDAQMGHFAGQADVALVGADALTAEGGVINKAGTYLLGLAASHAGIPFYVCCESFKLRQDASDTDDEEEMAPEELGAPGWPGIRIANVYFDHTPADLVNAWITENGVEYNELNP